MNLPRKLEAAASKNPKAAAILPDVLEQLLELGKQQGASPAYLLDLENGLKRVRAQNVPSMPAPLGSTTQE